MNFKHHRILLIALAACAPSLWASLPEVNAGSYSGEVSYEVWLPNADEPIEYDVSFTQRTAPEDTLMPCSYLIVSSPKGGGEKSFAAYFDGNFFRFRGDKLVEWHAETDQAPFAGGVPRAEMFASLLPAFIRESFQKMEADSSYIYNVEENDAEIKVNGTEERQGYLMRQYEYRFDPAGRPLYSEITINPGGTTEQIASAAYSYPSSEPVGEINENLLVEMFPEVFEKFREGNFSLASLQGRPMPTFSLQTSSKQRFSHMRGAGFDRPTLFAVLDSYDSSPVSEIRRSVPADIDIVYIFAGNEADAVTEAVGTVRPSETVAYSARGFIRDCGVTDFPTFILCSADGIIKNFHIGANKSLHQIVLELVN